jgi:hypothetical protein
MEARARSHDLRSNRYRGSKSGVVWILNCTSPQALRARVAVRAYNGVVEVTQAPGKVSLYQDQKGLEKYLLGLLKARGDWALIQRRIRKARRASPAALEAIGE